jgi:hypothetical protein
MCVSEKKCGWVRAWGGEHLAGMQDVHFEPWLEVRATRGQGCGCARPAKHRLLAYSLRTLASVGGMWQARECAYPCTQARARAPAPRLPRSPPAYPEMY